MGPGALIAANGDGRFLHGRVAVVTGGASGGGRATALRLAAAGVSVVVADIDAEGAARVAGEIEAGGGTASSVRVDVREERDVVEMVAAAVARYGRLDILHNNAADLRQETRDRDVLITSMEVEAWDDALAVNLRGPMLGCKHAIPVMQRQGRGVIVNTSSTAAFKGDVRQGAYAAAKAGLLSLTRTVATMYGRDGIRCNAIAPGSLLTPATEALFSEQEHLDLWSERVIDEVGRPEDMAGLVAFLASDDARYITGQVIVFDGGMTIQRPMASLRAMRSRQRG